jgi:hypothetical protein
MGRKGVTETKGEDTLDTQDFKKSMRDIKMAAEA